MVGGKVQSDSDAVGSKSEIENMKELQSSLSGIFIGKINLRRVVRFMRARPKRFESSNENVQKYDSVEERQ